jgi:hypothetical protein
MSFARKLDWVARCSAESILRSASEELLSTECPPILPDALRFGDQGADPNKLVVVLDSLENTDPTVASEE